MLHIRKMEGETMTCAEYLVDYLIKKGVSDVFGFSGGYIVPFMDALYA